MSLWEFRRPAASVLRAIATEVDDFGWKKGIETPEKATFLSPDGLTITFMRTRPEMNEPTDLTCLVLVPSQQPWFQRQIERITR
jgi:hypothetical protein